MRLADVLPDSAFRLSLKVVVIFAAVLSLASILLYKVVTNALEHELKIQAQEELVLFSDILQDQGSAGLVNAMNGLASVYVPAEHVIGLFSEDNKRLAGNISLAPEFVGWRKTSIELIQAVKSEEKGKYHAISKKINGYTLVVGRSDRIVRVTQKQLVIWLLVSTLFISITTLLLGYATSRQSAKKLTRMDKVLEQVANGETESRITLNHQSDLIDSLGKKINHHLDRLSELITGIKTTSSAIAHDLKTPLAHTQISLYQALETCDKGENPSPAIESALTEIGQLNSTFDTILRISRINTQTDRSHFQPTDLWLVIDKIIEFYEPVVTEAGNTLSLEPDKAERQPLIVNIDSGMIEQLLVNLLKNIQVHCPTGTHITISANKFGQSVQLSVSDNGPGIPEAELETITKPFHRLDRARTKAGNGLGLALASAIVRQHNGRLTLSNLHPGLEVKIEFNFI